MHPMQHLGWIKTADACLVAHDKASNIATTRMQMDLHTTGKLSHSVIKATEPART